MHVLLNVYASCWTRCDHVEFNEKVDGHKHGDGDGGWQSCAEQLALVLVLVVVGKLL